MKAQPPFGLAWSWPRVSIVFLLVIGILVLSGELPDGWQPAAWWTGVGLASVVALLGLVTHRGLTVPSAIARRWREGFRNPAAGLTRACTPAVSHRRRYGRETVGMRGTETALLSVINVGEPDTAAGGRHAQDGQNGQTDTTLLSVSAVASGLQQFDVHIGGIDIVSVRDGSAETGAPEPGRRSTWLVLRMDPVANVGAVATRDSLASTLAAATERLALGLDGRELAAVPATAEEIAEADRVAWAGLNPVGRVPGWRHITTEDGFATSFWVSPDDITAENLEALWLPEAQTTITVVRLSGHHRGTQISALVRYHTAERLPKESWVGLNPLTARQLPAVRATLPAPEVTPRLALPSREFSSAEELTIVAGRLRPRGAATEIVAATAAALEG